MRWFRRRKAIPCEVVNVRPGDLLILHTEMDITADGADKLRQAWRAAAGRGVPVVCYGVKGFSVIRGHHEWASSFEVDPAVER